jgi:hypothetical protein
MSAVYDNYYAYVNETKSGAFLILSVVMGVLFAVGLANTGWGTLLPGSQPFLPLVLVAFGCIFYAVPRRVTRAAGGALISWPLVFYFGLPLLPAFAIMYGMLASYHEISCTVQSCPLLQTLFNTLTGQGSSAWFSLTSNLINFGLLISDNAAQLIWMNLFLPVIYLTILSLAAAGVGRLFGGYVNLLSGA